MSTLEEVRSAEKAMRDAEKTLRAYRARPASEQDGTVLHQLAADMKGTTQDYVSLVLMINEE